MEAVGAGPSEATQRDLAALMKLWSAPEVAAVAASEPLAPAAAPPAVTCLPPAAALPLPASDASSPSFGGREGWLTDFVAPLAPGARPAAPRAAVAPAEDGTASGLRCLDATHDATCAKCRPAPPFEAEATWLLMGENGAKNGEKRLRRLLTRTSQWADTEERRSTAAALQDAPRMDVLARVLCGEANCGDLRKTHLLALCRAWGYRCDIWSQRSEASSMRKGDAATRAATAVPLRPPRAAKRDSGEVAAAAAAAPAAHASPPARKRAKGPSSAPEGGVAGSFLQLWGPLPPLMPTHGFAGADVARLATHPPLSYHQPYRAPVAPPAAAWGVPWACIAPSAPPPQRSASGNHDVAQPRPAAATLELLPAGLRRAGVSPTAFSASLAPFATAYRQLTAGERARVAATTHGAPFLDARILAELAVSRANLVAAARAFVIAAADIKALRLCDADGAPGPRPGSPPPAWMALEGRDMPGEALCAQLSAACGASARDTRARLAIADAAAAEDGDDNMRAAERIWLADSLRVQHTAMHAMTHTCVLLRELQLGYADEYAPAAGALLDAAAVVCAAGVQGVDARSAWVAAYIRTSDEADAALGLGGLDPPEQLPWMASRMVIRMPQPVSAPCGAPPGGGI